MAFKRWLAVVCVVLSGQAAAGLITLHTGTANWPVSQTSGTDNGLGIGTTASAVALTGTLPLAAHLPGFEACAWANPFGGAIWVGQRATDGQFTNGGSITCGSPCGAAAGLYSHSFSFDASLGGAMTLAGFTADNGVRSLSLAAVGGGLVTITAVVQNLDGPGRNPSGFILAGSATVNDRAVTPVPEPGSLALVTLAVVVGGAVRRRRLRV